MLKAEDPGVLGSPSGRSLAGVGPVGGGTSGGGGLG